MSQTNQPFAKNLTSTPFYDVNTVGQTFGLEPNYPCCTVNHPQGLPRFLQSSYVMVGTSGLLHALLSPASVSTTVNGGSVTVECETNYPFENGLFYNINAAKAFDFYVRVPAWATSAVLSNGGETKSSTPENEILKISVPKGRSRLLYTIGTDIRTSARANDTVAVYRGALLYSIPIASDTTDTPPHNYYNFTQYPSWYAPPESHDYIMRNTTEWNIAIDPSTLQYVSSSPSTYHINYRPASLPSPMFAAGAPPMFMTAKGCLIDWPLIFNQSTPGPPPIGDYRKCLGESFIVKLVPYGSAKLHMAELPTIDLKGSA